MSGPGPVMAEAGMTVSGVERMSVPAKAGRTNRAARRRQPYSWLGAGVLGVGMGVGVALAGGTGVAHADSATAGDASPSATSASASSKSASAGVGRTARGSGAATGRRQSGSASSAVSDRSVVAAARRASVVKPTPADMEAQAAQFQVQLAHSFHDAREWVSTALPGPVGGAKGRGPCRSSLRPDARREANAFRSII